MSHFYFISSKKKHAFVLNNIFESHFDLQVMAHVHLQIIFTAQNEHTKYQILFHFQSPGN